MSTTIDIRELPARWEEVLALVSSGCEVLLLDGTIPRARLVPCQQAPPGPMVPGLHPGALEPAEDFDAPLLETEAKPTEGLVEFVDRLRREMEAASHKFRTKEEIDAELEELRNEWEERLEELGRARGESSGKEGPAC